MSRPQGHRVFSKDSAFARTRPRFCSNLSIAFMHSASCFSAVKGSPDSRAATQACDIRITSPSSRSSALSLSARFSAAAPAVDSACTATSRLCPGSAESLIFGIALLFAQNLQHNPPPRNGTPGVREPFRFQPSETLPPTARAAAPAAAITNPAPRSRGAVARAFRPRAFDRALAISQFVSPVVLNLVFG